MAFRPTSYVPHRWALYSLLWLAAVAELALTAIRLRHTHSFFHTHEAIVAELLVASILTILWVPMTLLFHRSAGSGADNGGGTALSPRHGETGGNLVLWILWLVGAAIVTHRWPTRAIAATTGQRDVVTALVALAWICFGLLTLAKIFGLMEYAAIRAVNAGAHGGYGRGGAVGGYGDKPVAGTGARTGAVGPGAAV